jgi:hypothetical protein
VALFVVAEVLEEYVALGHNPEVLFVTPCSLVSGYHCFGGTYFLHLQTRAMDM